MKTASAASYKRQTKIEPTEISAGIYLLFGEINTDSIRDACAWILAENISDNPHECLNMIINSPGGSLMDAFALISIMKSSAIPIRTISIGEVASAGLIIAMTGTKGLRTIAPNTTIMSHNFSTTESGTYDELKRSMSVLDKTSEMVIAHYVKHTGLSKEEVKTKLVTHKDIYLSPKQAVSLGLFDVVSDLKMY